MNFLPHIAARVFAAPLMITPSKLDVILGVLVPRLQGEALPLKQEPEIADEIEIIGDGIAVIPILGTLVRRTVGLQAISGLMSYAEIGAQIQSALENNAVKAILLDFDSPGGEAGGVFDLADQIYEARRIKPVWAVANEESFSAAYALAAAAEKIYIPRTGGVGSIGVIAVHLDQSQADAEEGLKYTPIFAGARKNDYSPHEPLADPARAALQKEVDRVYGLFIQSVARGRGLSPDAVRKTEAGLFFGEDGIAAGLADKIGTLEDALADLSDSLSLNPNRKDVFMTKPDPHIEVEEEDEDLPDLDTLKADFIEKTRADAKAEAMAYVAEVHDLCALAGVPLKATDYIVKGVPAEDVRRELLEAKANASDAAHIAGHIPTPDPVAKASIDTAAIYSSRNNQKGN